MLALKNVSWATPSGRTLVTGVSLTLGAGQWLIVRGPNGSGKSTLLQVVMNKLKHEGTIDRGYRSLGYLPQLENTEFHIPSTLGDVLKLGTSGKLQDWGLLEPVQLTRSWNTASGGERKRALLTRLLSQDCDLLCLDEPLNHLDKASRVLMATALKRYVETGTRAGVLVAHEGFDPKDLGGMRCLELVIADGKATVRQHE